MVKIRLQRVGAKKRPYYRIVAADSRVKRDGKFIEILGQYHPISPDAEQLSLKEERVQHWIQNGAKPTDTMVNLLKKSGLWKNLSTKSTT